MLQPFRKPLICMSPKSLLRHKLAVSTLDDFSTDSFKKVIDDIDANPDSKSKPVKNKAKLITRIILCSGKVYYDLLEQHRLNHSDHIAIIRIEQLYPFPEKELTVIINHYDNVQQIIWCQEEPRNQGAWYNIRHILEAFINPNRTLTYVGRAPSAAPAVGVARIHAAQQKSLVDQALDL